MYVDFGTILGTIIALGSSIFIILYLLFENIRQRREIDEIMVKMVKLTLPKKSSNVRVSG